MIDKSPSTYDEDELNIRETIKILIDSKKLIISSIFFFTIAASIYSHFQKSEFKTSALIEIGRTINPQNETKLIEQPESLIRFLRINEIKNKSQSQSQSQKLSLKVLEGRLISMEISSISPKRDRELLNQYISKIKERHIEKINSASELLNNKIDSINGRIYLLNLEFKDVEEPNSGYYQVLFQLESEIENLMGKLDLLHNSSVQKTKLIGDVKSIDIKIKSSLIIIVGFVLGLIAGIFLVLINNSIKSYRQ